MSTSKLGEDLNQSLRELEEQDKDHAELLKLNARLNELIDGGETISEAERLAISAPDPAKRQDGNYKGSDQPYKRVRPLTKGQSDFTEALIEGLPMKDAYRKAYPNAKGNDACISACGYRLYRDKRIQERVRDAQDRTAENLADDLASTKRYVLRTLLQIIRQSDNDHSRLRALELMGKASGAFEKDQSAQKQSITPEQLKREIGQHLKLVNRKTV